jgi:hypothetical protein
LIGGALLAAASVMSETDNKFDILSTKVGTMLGYPRVDDEVKVTRGKTAIFSRFVVIFAGPLMISTIAVSPNRGVGAKTLDEFVAGMQIDLRAPSPPRTPPGRDLPPTSPI